MPINYGEFSTGHFLSSRLLNCLGVKFGEFLCDQKTKEASRKTKIIYHLEQQLFSNGNSSSLFHLRHV